MSYSIQNIARIISAEMVVQDDRTIEHLLLDSRKLYSPATSLFFAISGARRDGHQFISELYKRGVLNFVISRSVDRNLYPDANFLLVNDTILALQQVAAARRSQFNNVPVIGITGSNGKTIVKEWLYQLLQDDFNIVRSPKSYNSQTGVPLSVWQMNDLHTLAIFEAGISQPGEMENLEKIIQPSIGVLTNIGEAHSEGFASKDEKLAEKLKLFRHCAIVIGKGEYLGARKQGSKTRFITWGSGAGNDLIIQEIVRTIHHSRIIYTMAGKTSQLEIPFTDDASIENAITCTLVCIYLKQDDKKWEERLKNLQPVNMRLELKKGINNCSIINDSYSADLSSLEIALNFLDHQNAGGLKTAILSDFLQSGLSDEMLYQKIAEALKQHGIDKLIGIGPAISTFLQPVAASITQEYFPTTEAFIQHYRFSQFKDEAILVKGARTFAFEQIIQLLEQQVHQTVLEINLNAIGHNLRQYQRVLKPATKVMAMVKAFAYGSGGAEIAGILQYHKVDWLGVAYADEGVELRKAGITLPIMVMNPEEMAFESIIENNLEPEIYSFDLLEAFDKFLRQEGLQQYPVHIEVETGMNRLGFATDDMEKLADTLQAGPSFRVQSVFSHLAASEEAAQDAFTFTQFGLFKKAAGVLEQKLGYSFIRHIANSAGAIRHPELQMDMIRLGIGLYGVDGSGKTILNLQTVATLKSTIAQVKHIKKGESVSYNRRGIVERDSAIATIRLGYADGYPRRLSNGVGKVWLNNRLAPVIGTVCMDMFMIDITGIDDVRPGDDVIVFGDQLPVQQLAGWANTIPYEIMTGISQRVKRVYFEE